MPQPPPRFEIMSAPLALQVRTECPAAVRPLAPPDPQPLQILDHRPRKFLTRALRIKVLIAQNECAVPLDGSLRRDPERARMADMQQPRGRRRQPPAITVLQKTCNPERSRGSSDPYLIRLYTPLARPLTGFHLLVSEMGQLALRVVVELDCHRAMRSRSPGAQRRRDQRTLRDFLPCRSRALRRLRVHLDAIRTLRRERHRQRDQF